MLNPSNPAEVTTYTESHEQELRELGFEERDLGHDEDRTELLREILARAEAVLKTEGSSSIAMAKAAAALVHGAARRPSAGSAPSDDWAPVQVCPSDPTVVEARTRRFFALLERIREGASQAA